MDNIEIQPVVVEPLLNISSPLTALGTPVYSEVQYVISRIQVESKSAYSFDKSYIHDFANKLSV